MIATIKPTRKCDWEQRLFQFVESKRHSIFKWGTNDCFLFTADAVISMADVDIAKPYRGKYNSAKGSKRFGSLQQVMNKSPLRRKKNNYQTTGDIVLFKSPKETLGICVGSHIVALGEKGLLNFKNGAAILVWSID